ncbi:sigma-54-dependent transcriptional regulator [Aestuariirhabdus litorea]|uniref:Sigma-54-dependent Fis family transcriptional regulator n=1 Tax=Aestuariirhabdus litorea TaxID=2528527 RepID=A0A3P3VKF0_9GAMM|nr:sigma-54 dependent transcriptional regulator [Aestuariirhabdus litorea]RRJ82249.1 sigma-54-dependent Fis family transcriptional regulator [Aestuariirhabdus litorea]RWW92417.1 response regulator [Endozoicomonadaceae bacterium GTF-13]
MQPILIVEDEPIIRSALRRLLERNDYQVREAGSVQEALQNNNLQELSLIISDLRLPGEPGTDMIKHANGTPVLIMTSYASLRSAVDSMKMGAVDYIAKPFDHEEMLQAVKRITLGHQDRTSNPSQSAGSDSEAPTQGNEIIGQCPPMLELFKRISKVAPTDTTVLILGESGTGKELVARALHRESRRTDAPLISVNCAAIPETLIESELFGHEKGAFTGATNARNGLVEAADGGTLFLDEIGELPLEAQARLLRVLQEGEIRRVGSVQSHKVNVRLIAATHRNLKALAKTGEFREDLYYRLNVMQLQLPALRERGSDVIEIAQKLLQRTCEKLGKEPHFFSPESLQAIAGYHWPGNVRELENAVERAVILAENGIISHDLLDIEFEAPASDRSLPRSGGIDDELPLGSEIAAPQASVAQEELSLEDYFQHFVLEHQDKMTETELAQKLGISRKCLWERRQRLGIPRKKSSTTSH